MVGRPKQGSGHPTVSTARSIAQRHELERCVVFFVTPEGRFGYASYGKDRATCEDTRRMADLMYDVGEQFLSHAPQLLEGSLGDLLDTAAFLDAD